MIFYDLAINKKNDIIVEDIEKTFNNNDYESLTGLVSASLTYGTPIKVLIKQLRKSKSSNLSDFSKAIARILTKYLVEYPNNEKPKYDPDFAAYEGDEDFYISQ